MPIGHPLPRGAKHVALNCPAVAMTKSEAEALTLALGRARQRIVTEVKRIGRSRIPSPEKVAAVAALRADLATLQTFQEAHDEAHGLGGY